MKWSVVRRVGMFMLVAASLFGCSTAKINMGLSSNHNLNPDRNGKPLAVVVRVYQLADKGSFDSSTFEQIWKDDAAALGNSLLTRTEITMNPSAQQEMKFDRHQQAKFVGVVALFRHPDDKKWREAYELSSGWVSSKLSLDSDFKVNLVGNTLHITE